MGFVTPAQDFDVVSLGDVVTDEFIHLPEGPVRAYTDDRGRWLEIPLGTKLTVADGSLPVIGGSAANAAVSLSRLGLRVGLASYLAHDEMGLDILRAMHAEDVSTALIHVDSPTHTVRNFVLSFAGERTILVRHAEFNYHWTGLAARAIPTWLYVNSLGPDALEYQDQIVDWLDQYPAVHLAFQPGTFQIEAGATRLARLYARAEVLICSRSAVDAIVGSSVTDPNLALDSLLDLGPRSVVAFDSEGGAVAADQSERLQVLPLDTATAPLDPTGTGDAFASTIVAALIRRIPFRDALRWAPINVAAVAGQFGAQSGLLRHDELMRRLDQAESTVEVLEV